MNFNSYASLAILFNIPVLVRFVYDHETIYTKRVLAVFDFSYHTNCPFRFLFEDFRVCSRYNNVCTALDRFINLCLVLLLLFADSLVLKLRFQLTKKT